MNLANYIEHTNLSPVLTIQDIDKLVEEAKQYSFLGVCVPPFWVKRAQREIGKEPIKLISVAGFPLGYTLTETKLDDIKRCIENGANEVDVVWNISSFKTGIPWTKIELAKCAKLAHDNQTFLKVIIETAYLSDEEILEEEATPGQRVAVIFFGGGSPSKCINWDLKISGDENIKLVKPKRNEARHLDSVLQNDDGSVSALFKSVGGKDGIKMLVKDGDTFVVEGKARNCDNSESREVEYETKVITKAKIKIWTGDRKDEVGKSVLKLRISTLKRGEKVAAKLEKKEEKAEEKSEKKTEKEEKKAAKKN